MSLTPPTVTPVEGSQEAPRALSAEELRNQALSIVGSDDVAKRFLSSARLAHGPTELPVDVYQAIVTAQGKAMSEFLLSWAESIAQNAQRDRVASQKAQQKNTDLEVLRRANTEVRVAQASAELLKKVLVRVKNSGPAGRATAQGLEERLRPALVALTLASGSRTSPRANAARAVQIVSAEPPRSAVNGLAPPGRGGGVTT